MKWKQLKKVSAYVLAFALLLGTIPVSYISAQASGTYTGRLWLSGTKEWPHQCTATCLHLRGSTDGFLSELTGETVVLSAVDEESGVYLDGAKGPLWLMNYDGTKNAYMIGGFGPEGVTATANTTVTIRGTFRCSNQEIYGEDTVTFEETSFVYNGSTWVEEAEADESVALTYMRGDASEIDTSTTTPTGFEKDASWSLRAYAVRDGASGVYVDGQWKDVPLILLKYEDGTEVHKFRLDNGGVTAVAGTRVEIKGRFVQGNHVVSFDPIAFTFDGTSWSKETFTVTGLQNVRISDEQAWQIWMKHDGSFTGEASESFRWPATLNGEEIEGGLLVNKDGGMFFLNIWPTRIPSDGTAEATLVLHKGSVTGAKGSLATLKEDFTICFNNYGVSMGAPIQVDTSGVEFEVLQTYSEKTDIYLRPSKSDAFSESGDVRPTIITGGMQEGRWYFPQESGIVIGEQVFTVNSLEAGIEFVKYTGWITPNETGYYLGAYDESLIEDGTKLILKGLYQAGDKLVEYVPTVLQWNGSKWVKLTTLTTLTEGTTVIEPDEVPEDAGSVQYVTFEHFKRAEYNDSGWKIFLKPSETLQANIDEWYGSLQVTIRTASAKKTGQAGFAHASYSDGTACFYFYGLLPQDITEDTEIIIHAGSATSKINEKQMTLTKDCILQVSALKDKDCTLYESPSEFWETPRYDGSKWEIHLQADGVFSGNEGETFFWPAKAGGKETTVEVTKEGEHFVLHLTSLQLPTDGTEGTLVLDATTVIGNEGSVISLPTETTLLVNQYGLSVGNPIVPDTKAVGMTVMEKPDNTKAHLYLHAMKPDVFPVDTSWKVTPAVAKGLVDGTYYFHKESGLFVDESAYDVNKGSFGVNLIQFIKVDVYYNAGIPETEGYNEYFLNLQVLDEQIKDGTEVTLKGTFIYEGSLVEYLPTIFTWNEAEGKWSAKAQTTHVSGDANGDGSADIRDMVRMQRYISQSEGNAYQIPLSPVDGDLIMEEDTYLVDATDWKELRLNLLEEEQIELAAYCGPRRGGYRYYWDNDNDDGSDGDNDYSANMEGEAVYGAHPKDPKGGWEGWITEKDFQDYLNCGFTYLLPEQDGLYDFTYAGGVRPVDNIYESDLYEYMELAEKMNIPVYVHANSLTSMTRDTDGILTDSNKAFLDKLHADMSKYRMFKGYSLADEPTYASAMSFLATRNYLEALDPAKHFYTACLPMSAASSSLVADATGLTKEQIYGSYMDDYYQATGSFMYDLYPLIGNTKSGNRLDEYWFANLRLVAKHAQTNKYDAGITVQSTSYGYAYNYKMQPNPEYHRGIETKADVGFQVYTALAYGMKNINYYSYWTHWTTQARGINGSAMVNYPMDENGNPINGADGVKTNAYYAVKEINQEIKKFDHVFLDFDWKGTMALVPSGATMSEALSGVLDGGNNYQPDNLTAKATQETIIGCMQDDRGRDGYMIANATEPSVGKTSVVTVSFEGATRALAYIEGNETEITLTNGTYQFEIGAGEGVFVIPLS